MQSFPLSLFAPCTDVSPTTLRILVLCALLIMTVPAFVTRH